MKFWSFCYYWLQYVHPRTKEVNKLINFAFIADIWNKKGSVY